MQNGLPSDLTPWTLTLGAFVNETILRKAHSSKHFKGLSSHELDGRTLCKMMPDGATSRKNPL